MPDDFARLIPDARAFLTELAANNNRDWFTGEKSRYDARLKTPASLLLDRVAAEIRRETGQQMVPKLFRPQRDLRFSRDKTPYHTHLHMLWSGDGKGIAQPALFFGIAPDYVTLGGGVMNFSREALPRWRAAADGPQGAVIARELSRLADLGLAPRGPDLKRVPAPYAGDHPRGDLLRRKGLSVWREMVPGEWDDPSASLLAAFHALRDLLALLGALR